MTYLVLALKASCGIGRRVSALRLSAAAILCFVTVYFAAACQAQQQEPEAATEGAECSAEKDIESGGIIKEFGRFRVQGTDGLKIEVCKNAKGHLTYSLEGRGSALQVNGPDAAAPPTDQAAGSIRADQPWGLLWDSGALWIYSKDSGAFSWRADGDGKFHAGGEPSSPIAIMEIGKIIKVIQSGPVGELAGRKDQFKPFQHGYPQIIQARDYETIAAIEALFDALKGLGDTNARWTVTSEGLRFEYGSKSVTLSQTGDNTVIGDRTFRAQEVAVFFGTLRKALAAVADPQECDELRFRQLGTRTYKQRTIIEFGCLPEVVQVESLSNGPNDPERLYILDIVEAEKSMEWSIEVGLSAWVSAELPGFRLAERKDYAGVIDDASRGSAMIQQDFDQDGVLDWATMLINDRAKEYRAYYLVNRKNTYRFDLLFTRTWQDAADNRPIRTPMFLKAENNPGISERTYNTLSRNLDTITGKERDEIRRRQAFYASVPAIEIWTGQSHNEKDKDLEDIAYCSKTWYYEKGQLRDFEACD